MQDLGRLAARVEPQNCPNVYGVRSTLVDLLEFSVHEVAELPAEKRAARAAS